MSLVLSRRMGEKISFRLSADVLKALLAKANEEGEDVEVIISPVRVTPEGVRIAIDAPRIVPVHRDEIWQRIEDENAEDVQTGRSSCDSMGEGDSD